MPDIFASHSSEQSYQDVFLDAFLTLAAKARESTDVAYVTAAREKLAVIGQAINLKSPHVWERLAAATLGPGRKMEDLPPLSEEDQAWRQAFAEAITIDLPAARGMSPEDFARDGFYSHLGFSVLALFLPVRSDDSALILRARDLMLKDRPLTYEGWMTWDIHLRWRDGQDEERQGQSPFLYLYDQLHYTTAYLIPEGQWATMGDRKLFRLFHSLWATGGPKEKSKMYELARWKVYEKAPVPPALKERRQAQLTQFASHCLGQPADQWSGWSVVKENWNGLSAEKKSEVIGIFLSMMGERLDVPMVPRFEIVKESMDKKDGMQFSDGCYRAWDVKADASGKEYAKWTNTISFLDSEDQRERPSYLNISARCMAFSAVHELLHADHEQMISRVFSSAPSRADYFLQLGGVEAVDEIGLDHPLYPASSILAGNTYGLDRSQYVRIDESEEMYRAQPTEKYVYAFDFNFASIWNGTGVLRDVESGRRDLGLELKAAFDLAGRFLAYRDQMVGAGDFEKLVNTEKKHLYFGLNLKAPQTSAARDDLYGTLMPLAYFRTKRDALGVLTVELDKLTSQPDVAEETKISFYRMAAGFLAQVPSEVVWLRQMRKEETDLLQDMFNNVFRQTLSMAEDLGDYAYMAQHPSRQSAALQAPRQLYG